MAGPERTCKQQGIRIPSPPQDTLSWVREAKKDDSAEGSAQPLKAPYNTALGSDRPPF